MTTNWLSNSPRSSSDCYSSPSASCCSETRFRHTAITKTPPSTTSIPTSPDETRSAGALAHAFEQDLERSSHIRRARAELLPDEDLIRLRLDIDDDFSVDELVTTVIDPR
jgi:hypothetical protein